MKKLFLISVMCLMTLAMQADRDIEYVDLGLPSGTLWCSSNEWGSLNGGFYSYDEGVNEFGNSIPTRTQWRELLHSCIWIWTGKGYQVTGNNGNSIYLPAEGWIHCDGRENFSDGAGWYWTSTPEPNDPECAYSFIFGPGLSDEDEIMGQDYRCTKRPIRLIQNRNMQNQSERGYEDYIDLNLPSGTLWKSLNENGGLFSYDEASNKYGHQLPSKTQWKELLEQCTWEWTGDGYRVTGDNGNSIYLPTTGWRNYYGDGGITLVGLYGAYWSSVSYKQKAWGLGFDADAVGIGFDHCRSERSVRLVKSK